MVDRVSIFLNGIFLTKEEATAQTKKKEKETQVYQPSPLPKPNYAAGHMVEAIKGQAEASVPTWF